VDGQPVAAGKLPPLKIGPGEGIEVTLTPSPSSVVTGEGSKPAPGSPPHPPKFGEAGGARRGERFLNFRFYQRRATLWAPAGHEVAWQQLALPPAGQENPTDQPDQSGVEATEDDQTITLRHGQTRAVFNKAMGTLVAYDAGRGNVIVRGPLLNVWRAATDNDGIKLLLEQQQNKPLYRWLNLGLNRVKHRLDYTRLIPVAGRPGVEIVHRVSGRDQWHDFTHIHRYTLLASGELQVENSVQIGNGISDIPRVGVSLMLAPGLEKLTWFGRGPWENYCDRKAAAMIGRYTSTVSGEYVPYIMPQEHGHKTDVRWLTLTDAQGWGLQVAGDPTLEFSASHFTAEDLYAATHTSDLQPRAEVILNLDHAQRGLGTASCGPDTLESYRLLATACHFIYRLQLLPHRSD